MRWQEKKGQNKSSVKRNRKKKQAIKKHFDLKEEERGHKRLEKGNRFVFEYGTHNKLGIIPGNETETFIFKKRGKMPTTSF